MSHLLPGERERDDETSLETASSRDGAETLSLKSWRGLVTTSTPHPSHLHKVQDLFGILLKKNYLMRLQRKKEKRCKELK